MTRSPLRDADEFYTQPVHVHVCFDGDALCDGDKVVALIWDPVLADRICDLLDEHGLDDIPPNPGELTEGATTMTTITHDGLVAEAGALSSLQDVIDDITGMLRSRSAAAPDCDGQRARCEQEGQDVDKRVVGDSNWQTGTVNLYRALHRTRLSQTMRTTFGHAQFLDVRFDDLRTLIHRARTVEDLWAVTGRVDALIRTELGLGHRP